MLFHLSDRILHPFSKEDEECCANISQNNVRTFSSNSGYFFLFIVLRIVYALHKCFTVIYLVGKSRLKKLFLCLWHPLHCVLWHPNMPFLIGKSNNVVWHIRLLIIKIERTPFL